MESGQFVKIYTDPITKTNLEGEAELIECVEEARWHGDLETWRVRFRSDGFVADRRLISV